MTIATRENPDNHHVSKGNPEVIRRISKILQGCSVVSLFYSELRSVKMDQSCIQPGLVDMTWCDGYSYKLISYSYGSSNPL